MAKTCKAHQGKFQWSDDKIYIDINAGLKNIDNTDDLASYTMLRTFSHEFTHFIEKWNPVWYNICIAKLNWVKVNLMQTAPGKPGVRVVFVVRQVVFDTLTERGLDVNELIEEKQSISGNMTYDNASREVVAEAMTDILPDANFVEALANEHKNIFEKLFSSLKEFLSDLKAYFKSLTTNTSREANALKETVGDTVRYVDNIVKLFDNVAAQAVENYQLTVSGDEVGISKMETVEVAEPIYEIYENRKPIIPVDLKELTRIRIASDKKFGLTKTESENLRRYVMSAYFMNAKMYSGNITESDIQYIDELQSALNKFPTFSGRTYRNLKFKDIQSYNVFLKEHLLNETVTLRAFTSTSKDPNGYKLFGNGVVHMVFDGVSGRDIADTYGIPRQQEVLFLPDTKYLVTNITVANDGNPLIYVKELSSNEKVRNDDGDFRGRESGLGTITQGNIPISRGEGYDNRGIHGNGRGTEDNGEKSRSTVNVKETSSNERVHEGRDDGHIGRDKARKSGSRTYDAVREQMQQMPEQAISDNKVQTIPERNTEQNLGRKTGVQGVQGEATDGELNDNADVLDSKDTDIRYQQRTNTLTDREVLELAADEVKVDDLTSFVIVEKTKWVKMWVKSIN